MTFKLDWNKASAIVIIDGECRPEVAAYVTKIYNHGCYISYQWFPAFLPQNSTTGIPSPAMHIYEDIAACEAFDQDRKTTEFGMKAVLKTLEQIVKILDASGCQCDSLSLFNYGCRCGK